MMLHLFLNYLSIPLNMGDTFSFSVFTSSAILKFFVSSKELGTGLNIFERSWEQIDCNGHWRLNQKYSNYFIFVMGVNQLWSILEPVKQEQNVSSLMGKTLCVDLSGWICEAQCAKGLKASVHKPHLRNTFFRVLNLTRFGVRLVFVVDGEPPVLKWEAMAKRVQSRYGTVMQKSKTKGQRKMRRSNFTIWVNEVSLNGIGSVYTVKPRLSGLIGTSVNSPDNRK